MAAAKARGAPGALAAPGDAAAVAQAVPEPEAPARGLVETSLAEPRERCEPEPERADAAAWCPDGATAQETLALARQLRQRLQALAQQKAGIASLQEQLRAARKAAEAAEAESTKKAVRFGTTDSDEESEEESEEDTDDEVDWEALGGEAAKQLAEQLEIVAQQRLEIEELTQRLHSTQSEMATQIAQSAKQTLRRFHTVGHGGFSEEAGTTFEIPRAVRKSMAVRKSIAARMMVPRRPSDTDNS